MTARPIREVAEDLGLDVRDVEPYGTYKAKVRLEALGRPSEGDGRLVLVSALTPTSAGEGKTTVSIGLAMAMRRLRRRTVVCVREPSLGPVFGLKGGGTGGGRARLVPSDDINLHFNGDFHAVTSAHNLLAALVDHELFVDGPQQLDPRRVYLPRVLDVDDRALRNMVIGLGGPADGVARQSRFDITAASEIMAALSLAESIDDLRARLGRIVVGRSKQDGMVNAADLGVVDAMLALLLEAIKPNLVQTAEGGPALVHGGPFANIAHGCSSVLATRLGLRYADDVVTEAGFGFDLGGEKFLHIKCRSAKLWPRCVILVVTVRGLTHHGRRAAGGAAEAEHGRAGEHEPERSEFVERGLEHLAWQVKNVRAFGLEPIIAVNVFDGDGAQALDLVERYCRDSGIGVARVTSFSEGGEGALELARLVIAELARTDENPPMARYLYADDAGFTEKVRVVARTLYGAEDVELFPAAQRDVERFERAGCASLPVCIAKTHLSLSGDQNLSVLARGFKLQVGSVRLSAGAGFLVPLVGDISTMPGLPREPAAKRIRVDATGIHGLGGDT